MGKLDVQPMLAVCRSAGNTVIRIPYDTAGDTAINRIIIIRPCRNVLIT